MKSTWIAASIACGVIAGGTAYAADPSTACATAETYVKERLASPATARVLECKAAGANEIRGNVLLIIEAQNIFGATTRARIAVFMDAKADEPYHFNRLWLGAGTELVARTMLADPWDAQ